MLIKETTPLLMKGVGINYVLNMFKKKNLCEHKGEKQPFW